MDDVEIVEWVFDAHTAEEWRERQRDDARVDLDGKLYRIVEVFEVQHPFGAPGNKHVWMVKGQLLSIS